MCWNQTITWDDGQEHIDNFTETLICFLMAYPDNGNPNAPERVAQHYIDFPNEFTENDIKAAEALGARGHANAAAEDLMGDGGIHVREALENVDINWCLFEIDDNVWAQEVEPAVRAVIKAITTIRDIGFSVGTKLLYLKRPHLIPICDRLVNTRIIDHDAKNSDEVMDCINKIRQIGRANLVTITAAVQHLNEHLPNRDAYIEMSLVRALDAVIWFLEQKPRRKEYGALFRQV